MASRRWPRFARRYRMWRCSTSRLPKMSGIDVARAVKREQLATVLVILSSHRSSPFVASAVEAGIGGYVLKEDAAGDLLLALRSAARHELFLSPRVTRPALESMRRSDDEPKLSPREREVVRLLAEGLTSKEIAERLDLTPKTVDTYRHNLMTPLGLKNVAAVVRYALKHDLARLED